VYEGWGLGRDRPTRGSSCLGTASVRLQMQLPYKGFMKCIVCCVDSNHMFTKGAAGSHSKCVAQSVCVLKCYGLSEVVMHVSQLLPLD